MAGRLLEDPRTVIDTAPLGIESAEVEASQARQGDRGSTHRAGFQGDVKIAAGQARRSAGTATRPKDEDFGMRAGIVVRLGPIARLGDDGTTGRVHQNRTDRYLAARGSLGCQCQRPVHERRRGHGRGALPARVRAPMVGAVNPGFPCSARMSKPIVIGLTLDSEAPGGYSKFPWYAIRENYCTAILRAGGVPLPLPHAPALVETYAGLIDAVVVTGGAFDLDPSLYGDATRHDTVVTKDDRTRFEFALIRTMLAGDKPVLGICGGQQLLNVVLGGSLIQHIPDTVADALAHEQVNPRDQPGHDVRIVPGTLLHRLVGADTLAVNSAHHQAVRAAGAGVVINATAPDGVIEGIEHPRYRFCLGVQWHPEFEITPGDSAIFAGLIAAAEAEAQS